jgi:PAS domain S-box-containing protein
LLSFISFTGWGIQASLVGYAWAIRVDELFVSMNLYGIPSTISLSLILVSFSVFIHLLPGLKKLSQLISIVIFAFYGAILLSRLFGISNLYNLQVNLGPGLYVPFAITLLSVSILLLRPEDGVLALLVRESVGGVITRLFIPPFVLLIILGGYLTLVGERAGLYDSTFGLFLFIGCVSTVTVFLVWVVSLYLDTLEAERPKVVSPPVPRGEFTAFSLVSEKSKLERETKNRDIQSSQDRLKSVFAGSPNLVFIKNKEGFFEFVNRRFETVFHIASDALLGKTGVGYLPHEVADGWAKDDRAVLDLGQTISLEQRVRQEDGLNHTYFVTKFPLLDESGRPRAICGIGTDITDIKEYQNFLLQEKAKEEAILNSVGEGLIATDTNGKLLLMNKACSAMTGFDLPDLANALWTQVVKMEDETGRAVETTSRPLTQALTKKEKIISSDFYYVRKDCTRFPVSIIATPIIFEGRVAGVVAAFRDVTKEKQLEQAKDEFVSMVSHELKAPMTAVKGGLAIILKGDYGVLGEGLKSVLSRMFDYVGRLLNLVEDILKVSKIDSGALDVTLVSVNISQIVSEVVANLKVLADKKGIQLIKGELISKQVSGDPVLITEIITNLINNAIKFTERGSVTVFSREDNNLLNLYVLDTGVGISKGEQDNLFVKFQQISSSSGRPEGTGLGLYLSKSMAKRLGGDLRLADSIVGKGSTFVLTLPLWHSD